MALQCASFAFLLPPLIVDILLSSHKFVFTAPLNFPGLRCKTIVYVLHPVVSPDCIVGPRPSESPEAVVNIG